MDNLIKIAQDAMWTKKEVPSFKSGDTIKLTIEGEDEETAAAAMQAFLESNL